MGKHCATIHNVLKKKNYNYNAKFSIISILKKIDRDNFRKKITKKGEKTEKKNLVGNTIAIHSVL